MFSTIKGLVLGFSSKWTTTAKTKYKKILLGFPNENVKYIWCTVFGDKNWGYRENRVDGGVKPVTLKKGIYLTVTGKFEPDRIGGIRSFLVQSDGSRFGGFTVTHEARQHRVLTVPGKLISLSQDKKKAEFFIVNAKGEIYEGRVAYSSTKKPGSWNGLVIEGNPLTIDIDSHTRPNHFYFDNDAEGKVLAYGRTPSSTEAWSKATKAPGRDS